MPHRLIGSLTPSSVALNASMRTSSSSSSTSISRRFPGARLEELTPELPDPADRVRERPEGHHLRRQRVRPDDRGVLRLGYPLRMNPADPEGDAAFHSDHRSHH